MMLNAHENALMALLFASGDPVAPSRLAEALQIEEDTVKAMLQRLRIKLDDAEFALEVLQLGGHYQLATRPQHTPHIKALLNDRRNVPLSPAALEVLAAVAYNQPVTKSYIEQVRGVDSSGVVTSLVEKGLLEEAGRLDIPGRPIAYATTAHFLRTFGLSSLDELPTEPILEPQEEPQSRQHIEGQMGFDEEFVTQ